MKKIIIFAKTRLEYLKTYQSIAKEKNVLVDIVIDFKAVKITYKKNKNEIYFGKKNLLDYDLIYFQSIGNNPNFRTREIAVLVSEFAKQNQIPIIDQALKLNSPWVDSKSFEYLRLTKKKLAVIDSLFVDQNSYKKLNISYPIVAKVTNLSRGKGVFLIEEEASLKQLIKKHKTLILQKFIDSKRDLRILVIDNQAVAAISRYNRVDCEFHNSYPKDKDSKLYTANDEEKQLAIKAAKALNYQIAGVDLIYADNEELKILEVNRSPKFDATKRENKINIEEKIVNFLIKNCK